MAVASRAPSVSYFTFFYQDNRIAAGMVQKQCGYLRQVYSQTSESQSGAVHARTQFIDCSRVEASSNARCMKEINHLSIARRTAIQFDEPSCSSSGAVHVVRLRCSGDDAQRVSRARTECRADEAAAAASRRVRWTGCWVSDHSTCCTATFPYPLSRLRDGQIWLLSGGVRNPDHERRTRCLCTRFCSRATLREAPVCKTSEVGHRPPSTEFALQHPHSFAHTVAWERSRWLRRMAASGEIWTAHPLGWMSDPRRGSRKHVATPMSLTAHVFQFT